MVEGVDAAFVAGQLHVPGKQSETMFQCNFIVNRVARSLLGTLVSEGDGKEAGRQYSELGLCRSWHADEGIIERRLATKCCRMQRSKLHPHVRFP